MKQLLRFSIFLIIALTAVTQANAHKCLRCGGKGIIYFQHGTGTYGHNNSKRQCPICHQWIPSGVSHSDRCPDCGGTGEIGGNKRNSSRNGNSSSSSSSGSYSNDYSGLTPNEQLQLDMMNAQYQGYEGFMNENHCYGKIGKYNPNNHRQLDYLTKHFQNGSHGRLAAFSADGAGVVIEGRNANVYQNIPSGMADAILKGNKQAGTFIDIALSDYGKYWSVIYDVNGVRYWHAYATDEIYGKLNELCGANKKICTVAIDDFNRYIISCDDGTTVCSSQYVDLVNKARNKFGNIKCASITAHGSVVLCCERGVYFNYIASSAADVLKKLDFIPRYIKTSYTGHYFISDNRDYEHYTYYYWM